MSDRAPTLNFEVDDPEVEFVFANCAQDDLLDYITTMVFLLFGDGQFSIHGEYNDEWYPIDAGYSKVTHVLVNGEMIPGVEIIYDDEDDDPPPSSEGGAPNQLPVEYEIAKAA